MILKFEIPAGSLGDLREFLASDYNTHSGVPQQEDLAVFRLLNCKVLVDSAKNPRAKDLKIVVELASDNTLSDSAYEMHTLHLLVVLKLISGSMIRGFKEKTRTCGGVLF